MRPSYHVYVSERGNIFMREIASLLTSALDDLGYHTVYPATGLPEQHSDRINLVVAPHEFFPLQRGVSEVDLLRAAECSAVVGVEQPGTFWFELGAHYAAVARHVLDISQFAVDELRGRGIPATHLQLGYHPSFDRWGGNPKQGRDVDFLFLGSLTRRREEYLSIAAEHLWDGRCDLRLFEFPEPMVAPRGHFVAAEDKWDLLANSQILLNVHRNDEPYFEWVRVLESLVNGCLVITEPAFDLGPLLPGEHLLVAPPELIGAYAADLMIDQERRLDIVQSAYDLVRTKLELTSLLEPICNELAPASKTTRRTHESLLQLARPQPAPEPVPPISPELAVALDTERRVHARVKELLDGETDLLRRIEALQARLVHGDADHVVVTATPAWSGFEPDVSVVMTSYNYANFVLTALHSVLASVDVEAELIIVDDHSDDDSLERLRSAMTSAPWFPIKLIARSANRGVSAARNIGIEEARSKFVFILDADNSIHPRGLHKLRRSLERAPDAAFSYGIIRMIGENRLVSHLPWDLTRLTQDNYIDAMALFRKEHLLAAGGYDEFFGLRGWEDYELWLRLAASGERGEFVSDLIGCYRVHTTSRQQTVNLNTEPLRSEFQARYPYLPWRED